MIRADRLARQHAPRAAPGLPPGVPLGRRRRGRIVQVTLLGEDWAVARIDGAIVALPDRCPHRFSPLSAGCVVDGAVQCAYHGYRFDAAGRCVLVPALGTGRGDPPKANLPPPTASSSGTGWCGSPRMSH